MHLIISLTEGCVLTISPTIPSCAYPGGESGADRRFLAYVSAGLVVLLQLGQRANSSIWMDGHLRIRISTYCRSNVPSDDGRVGERRQEEGESIYLECHGPELLGGSVEVEDRVSQDEDGEGGDNHEKEGPADVAKSASGHVPVKIQVEVR